MPMDDEGRIYHVGVKHGEVAQRVLTVGDYERAQLIASTLDRVVFHKMSSRGFETYTGFKNNV